MALSIQDLRKPKVGRHSDGKGLYLLVKPKASDPAKPGSMSWVLRVQYRGQRRDFGLGAAVLDKPQSSEAPAPLEKRKILTLSEAREKAKLGRDLAKAGLDPSAEWNRVQATIPTFREAAKGYHAGVLKGWKNAKHGQQWLNTLTEYAFPHIGNMLVSEIDAPDILKVLLPIWMAKAETARRVKQRILTVLDYSKASNWRDDEAPVRALASLLRGLKQPKKGNFSAMPWQDVPAFMTKLRAEAPSTGRLALQFLILTAARSGEVRGTKKIPAKWSEIRWEDAEWHVPPERMKAGRLHIVPLVPAAMDILRQMRDLYGADPEKPIFPGAKGAALSDATLNKALRVTAGEGFTVHGFRSSFRDWAAETGIADAWAEAALAHTIQSQHGATIAAYLRTSFFTQRKEKLMPAWARFVLADESNVVSLAERRA
jgi:integrase